MTLIHKMIDLINGNPWIIAAGASISTLSLILILCLLPVVARKIPENYFTASPEDRAASQKGHPLQLLFILLKNVGGLLFILMGIVMLFTPGQGVLSVFVGVLLINFPGKRRLELKLIRNPKVLRFVNNSRKKHNLPEIQIPE